MLDLSSGKLGENVHKLAHKSVKFDKLGVLRATNFSKLVGLKTILHTF